jgi:two-component system chemotaxis response regulator CheB
LHRLWPSSAFHLCQARDGLPLNSGVAYFAPHDYHLVVTSADCLTLDRGPRRNGVRPSADVTMSSLAPQYGPAVIGVILSGIGRDGVQGALDVRAAGGAIIVQEAATCQADEMPAAIIEAGAATVVLPPEQIAGEIVRRAQVG